MKIFYDKPTYYEINIQRSIFKGMATYVESREYASDFIKKNSDKNASHNCWAYIVNGIENYSDDREPSGSAGKPILNAIKSLRLEYVVVLVTRYFGGKKLGIRGLIDAYSSTAKGALEQLPPLSRYFDLEVKLFYDKLSIVDYFLQSKKAKIDREKSEYTDRVKLYYSVPAEYKKEVEDRLKSLRIEYIIGDDYLK